MIVGEVLKGQGYPSRSGGLILPFEYEGGQYRLFVKNEEMDAVAAAALAGKKQREIIKPELVVVRDDESPTHRFSAKSVVANNGEVEAITAFHTLDEDDFSATVFRAQRIADHWGTTEMRTTTELDQMMFLVSSMTHELLRRNADTQASILRVSVDRKFEEITGSSHSAQYAG